MSAPEYTADDMAAQAASWFAAAEALRSGDPREALRQLYPPIADDRIVGMTCALCVVGIELTAALARREVGAGVGEPIAVDILQVAGAEPAAVTRLVCGLVQQAAAATPGAATADLAKRVVEWITPQGASLDVVCDRSALLLADLLRLFAAMSEAVDR